jgi:hypothetical protein
MGEYMYKDDIINLIQSLELIQLEYEKDATDIKSYSQVITELNNLRKERSYFHNETKKLNVGYFIILISFAMFISIDSHIGTILLAIGVPLTTIMGVIQESNKTMVEDISVEIKRRKGLLLLMKKMGKNFIILPEHHRFVELEDYDNSLSNIIFDRDIKTLLCVLSVTLGIYIFFGIYQ